MNERREAVVLEHLFLEWTLDAIKLFGQPVDHVTVTHKMEHRKADWQHNYEPGKKVKEAFAMFKSQT